MISSLNNNNFDLAVTHVPGLHVVRFWAEWCGPCRVMAPVYDEVAQELRDDAHFAEVNIDNADRLANKFRVQSVPAILLFRDGKVVDHMVGTIGKRHVIEFIKHNL
ncbi:thioredoxin [Janthinobacterium sp. GW458P]|uniref:thioredoxin n=1 Tax=Janthinobacterium sp. GW458P TaxID=1981504 RepID=UPI000A31FEF8|nr:thioredoxin [Janthinobacterium sp. GW458P]MBE3025146.1 thioredoxin [Janthinobacterium sp. GW458P]PHV16680.1 thioredoxin [Janthinobacterium sp. BJB303]